MASQTSASSGRQLAVHFARTAASFARARPFNADILVQFGPTPVLARVRDGAVVGLETQLPPLRSWDFAVRASERAWREFWRAVPAPGWHDLFALGKRGELSVEGNLQPLMANLQYVKDLLATGRESRT
ncbi:hypothetical protein [Bordetella genomosp. 2]|uniref:SCP2 domain-containing protein n=1 Tax=Bordetella genomosp. 2 TaxID=1983456 RepID=A0A261W077_9BORD|nr:hypothetical protein [Bordetella genomosp. 2]OZI79441.1 hypothetical protein CAL24_05780 [Bordetella genomosp. 2]